MGMHNRSCGDVARSSGWHPISVRRREFTQTQIMRFKAGYVRAAMPFDGRSLTWLSVSGGARWLGITSGAPTGGLHFAWAADPGDLLIPAGSVHALQPGTDASHELFRVAAGDQLAADVCRRGGTTDVGGGDGLGKPGRRATGGGVVVHHGDIRPRQRCVAGPGRGGDGGRGSALRQLVERGGSIGRGDGGAGHRGRGGVRGRAGRDRASGCGGGQPERSGGAGDLEPVRPEHACDSRDRGLVRGDVGRRCRRDVGLPHRRVGRGGTAGAVAAGAGAPGRRGLQHFHLRSSAGAGRHRERQLDLWRTGRRLRGQQHGQRRRDRHRSCLRQRQHRRGDRRRPERRRLVRQQ